MNDYRNEELKRLISESLKERPDSYLMQQLFEQFPTKTELMDVSEQQLIGIKGIGELCSFSIMSYTLFRLL